MLLGPSGCGKTTALRVLAGLEDADAGRIVVGGKDISAVPTNKRDMGMVFQAYSLFPHMTAAQNVAFGLRLRGMGISDRDARANEYLDLVGLAAQADRYAHQMSGGQQQRVALARALAIRPQVLLLDEPLSALDAKVRVQLRDEIRRIQLEVGITTLFVTHDQEEALAVADRVGVMRDGRIEQIDSPEVMYTRPTTSFVAEFIGLTNRLAGSRRRRRATVLDQPRAAAARLADLRRGDRPGATGGRAAVRAPGPRRRRRRAADRDRRRDQLPRAPRRVQARFDDGRHAARPDAQFARSKTLHVGDRWSPDPRSGAVAGRTRLSRIRPGPRSTLVPPPGPRAGPVPDAAAGAGTMGS